MPILACTVGFTYRRPYPAHGQSTPEVHRSPIACSAQSVATSTQVPFVYNPNSLTMEKVISRTTAAIRQASRRREKALTVKARGESWERNQTLQRQRKQQHKLVLEARHNRKIDWESGLLAPRRDVGDQKDTYGSISIYNVNPPEKEPKDRPKWMYIAGQDRVAVIRGRERGRIATVSQVDKESGTVALAGVEMVDVAVPQWMQEEENMTSHVQSVPYKMPLENVRLVFALPDPKTGVPRDVIIDRVVPVNRKWNKETREFSDGDRLIPGTNTLVPWPELEKPEHEDNDIDTLRITVEEQTFRPYLLSPPMPESVIDELRNKYSKFRTRHDWAFQRERELEALKVEKRKELGDKMRTPKQQMRDLKVQEGVAARERELSEAQLAKIGEVIAAEQVKVRGTVAGLS